MSAPALYQAVMQVHGSGALAVADLLEGLESPMPVSVSAFEVPGTADFHIQALYAERPVAAHLRNILEPLLFALDLPVPEIEVGLLADRNWVRDSLHRLPAVRAGRFFVAGSHEIGAAPAGAVALHIDAGEAFGTGHHETTTGCLLAMEALGRQRSFRRVLDLGCGTGVLAMAAAKLWRRPVVASDIDPVAVRVAAENARRNGLSALVQPITAAGFASPQISRHAPYDLIVANILARPLVRMALPLARHLAPGGFAVLSGLLWHQEPAICSAYRAQGLYLRQRFQREGWTTLTLGW